MAETSESPNLGDKNKSNGHLKADPNNPHVNNPFVNNILKELTTLQKIQVKI